jgi:putative ABC transport system permease protein
MAWWLHDVANVSPKAAHMNPGRVKTPPRAMARFRSALVLDSVMRDVRYACRSFLRSPLGAVTIVTTVGLGLGLVAAVFTILSSMVFRVDEVRSPHELFGIERQQSSIAQPETFTRTQYETLLRETDVFSDAFASTPDVTAWIEGVRREGRVVTGNFFRVLGVSAARGRALTPSDDEPGRPPVIVLSHRAWVQHYASDPGVLDGTFRVNGTSFKIVGVMPEGFRGLEVVAAPDFWAPLSLLDLFRRQGPREGSVDGFHVLGRLKPGVSRGEAQARLVAWDLQRAAERSGERPAAGLVLEPRLGTVPQPADVLLVFMPLFFAFGLILMIGCANVANLLLARLLARRREIGIRLAIGASRRRVVWQLLTESLLLALVAAAFGFAVSRLVLTSVVYVLTSSFPPGIGNLRLAVPPADWRVGLFLVAGALVSTVLFALAPALRATRLEVVRAIHGQALRGGRPGRGRDALVALQVTGSVLLLICAAIFLRSAWSSATVDPGVRTADIVNVAVLSEPQRGAVLDALRREPSVASVAASWPGWLGGLGGAPAYAQGASGKPIVTYQFVSPEYFGVLGVDLVRGRGFTDTERNPNEAVAVVSESVARELWPGADPLGQVLRVEPDPTIVRPERAAATERPPSDDPMLLVRTAVVIGVARDVAGFRIGGMKLGGAGVYMPIGAEAAGTALITRVRGDVERARLALIDRLAAIDPNMSEVSTLQTLTRVDAYILGMSFWLTLVLGSLALLLTLSGLYSVLSYLVEQRTKEIGVRMALGASRRSIGVLVLWQSSRPVGIGLLLGGSLTAGLGAALLATPAAEQIGSTVRIFDPVAYTASLLCIVAACVGAALIPALRAGRVNPLAALRQD